MSRKRSLLVLLSLVLWLAFSGSNPAASGQAATWPPGPVSGSIRAPDDYVAQPVEKPLPPAGIVPTGGLKAVAIVGDVGSSIALYKDDMNSAVSMLQSYGVSVIKFYYGETSFGWANIVAAAQGAHFLLYMGHGVYWGGDPLQVGGFFLGDGQFVSPDQIRNDLNGVLAADSIIIFSHACFTAGNSDDDPGALSQSEAARRVAQYADPFTDIGMKAYFSNNYFTSAARSVDRILSGNTMGNVFKAGIAYDPANLVDLTYPAPGYDLWLDGKAGSWDQSFVGIPGYVLPGQAPSALGDLPNTLQFLYSIPEHRLVPASYTLTPQNVGNDRTLAWSLAKSGSWFSASPSSSTTPHSFQIVPTTFSTGKVATYSGVVTVTAPSGVAGSPQVVHLKLRVISSLIRRIYLPIVR